MDRNDLLARIESATINWRECVPCSAHSGAKDLHNQLLTEVRGSARRKRSNTLSSTEIGLLLAKLQDASCSQIEAARHALDEMAVMPLCFEYEQENAAGERGMVNHLLDDIPYLYSLRLSLPLILSLMALPSRQQSCVVSYLNAATDLRHLEVRSQVESDLAEAAQRIALSLQLAAARSSADQAYAAMPPVARNWLIEHREAVEALGWSDVVLPVMARQMHDESMLQASAAFGRISEFLVRPADIDSRADRKVRLRWFELWAVCEDASEHLAVIAAWLRCLGSTGRYRRCEICFRHLGDGMKKNCLLHQRTAKQRVPSRELHVSESYQAAWRKAARSQGDIRSLLSDASPSERVRASRLEIARASGLTPRVALAAGQLAALLATLAPLLDPRLQMLVQKQFQARVAEADATTKDDRSWVREPPESAIRALAWERFFGEFFMGNLPSDAATQFSAGKPLDIDHPLTGSKAVPLQKLAVDLLHLSTWTSIDLMFDALAYLDVEGIRRQIKLAESAGRARPTFRTLASSHHTSAQAIQQAIAQKSSASRGNRILSRAQERLGAALRERPSRKSGLDDQANQG